MEFLETLYREFTGFFGFEGLIKIIQSGDYSVLLTKDGFFTAIRPVIPVLLVIEILRGLIEKNFDFKHYRISLLTYIFNRVVSRFISIAAVTFCIGVFEPISLLNTSMTWYWFIYGYIVWELAHFVYHYYGHKVRLFWCLHSTHHAPEGMNLSVAHAHFFLEGPYADVIRTSICIFLGVTPPMLFLIMAIDGTWGTIIHVGENLMKDGRMGFLNKFILTPSHHRVHHARNPVYMDTNFCNLLNIWDRAFGTLQPELKEVKIEYGITRPMKSGDFMDAYFGEFIALGKDVYQAPGLKNKLLYIVMPPGWSHTGDHKTANVVKREYRQHEQSAPLEGV